MRRLWLVAGQVSNLRDLIPDAVRTGGERGIDVRIADVSGLVPFWKPFPNDWASLGLADRVTTFERMDELVTSAAAEAMNHALALFLFLPERYSRPIWNRVARAGMKVGAITVGSLPFQQEGNAGAGALKVLAADYARKARTLMTRLAKPGPAFWIMSGRRCLELYRHFFRSVAGAKLVWAHSADYERVKRPARRRDAVPVNDSGHIAYIDQGWFSKAPPGFMPDGTYPPVEEKAFSAEMRGMLRDMAELTGKPVVVCAHPKSDLAHTRDLYAGFDVRINATNEVVAGARAVVATASTSVQYAVIHRKPLIFATTRSLSGTYIQSYIRGYSRALAAPVVTAGDRDALGEALRSLYMEKDRYDEFLCDYVIADPDDDRRSLWAKVFDGIEPLYG